MERENERNFRKVLIGTSAKEYGDDYRAHVLEIYRTYLGMADKISERREKANSFFLALNTAVVGFVGYVVGTGRVPDNESWLALVGFAGVLLSYLWYRIIRSYRGLNSAKFKVVHEIEALLPLKPYDAEWEAVGREKNPKLYLPFTHVEVAIPWIFLVLHVAVILREVPWAAYVPCPKCSSNNSVNADRVFRSHSKSGRLRWTVGPHSILTRRSYLTAYPTKSEATP